MRRVVLIIAATGLLLIPFAGLGQARQMAPPVALTLVREGEFAFKLADGLKMGPPGSEAEAESALASAGIAPRNGWIADYPITPDIAGELETAIIQAADSRRLALSRDEALMAFQGLMAEMGLSIVADTRGDVVQDDLPPDYGQYSSPGIISDYYYNEGPPVVTYYSPPWDYYYMYVWVPYPFWCSGFWFSGFFILNDFHRPIYRHGRPRFVSNHYRHHGSTTVYTVDPVTRHNGSTFTAGGVLSHGKGVYSAEARRGATSILERSTSGSAPNGISSKHEGSSRAPSATGSNRSFSPPSGSVSRPSTSLSLSSRSPSGGSRGAPSAMGSNRSFSPPSGSVSRPPTAPSLSSRSSSGGSRGAAGSNRSFTAPSTGSGGSFRGF